MSGISIALLDLCKRIPRFIDDISSTFVHVKMVGVVKGDNDVHRGCYLRFEIPMIRQKAILGVREEISRVLLSRL